MRILTAIGESLNRIRAVVVRYRYLMLASWPRLIELAYWPTVQMVLWGLINQFLVGQSEWMAQAAGLLIAAALLWDVLFRAQLGVSIVFFEEMYSRNLGNLFVSPLRPHELALSLLSVSSCAQHSALASPRDWPYCSTTFPSLTWACHWWRSSSTS